jgi:hypothetical protein
LSFSAAFRCDSTNGLESRAASAVKDLDMTLWRSFQDGGWAMWIIFALGLTGIGAAGRFAWRGEHQLNAFIRWMLLTVLGCGFFGTAIGLQRTLFVVNYRLAEFALPDDPSLSEQRVRVLLEGTREASNCLSAGLMFALLMCFLMAIGHRRFPLPNPSATAR